MWRRLRATHGAVPVTALAQESGCSARHLSSLLRAEVGLAPKAVARLFRCPPTRWLAEEFRFVQAAPEGAGRSSRT